MKFSKMEREIEFHLKLCNDATIVLDDTKDYMRTLVVHNHFSDEWWLYQSSWSHDEGETDVDIIRLTNRLLKKLEIAEFKDKA